MTSLLCSASVKVQGAVLQELGLEGEKAIWACNVGGALVLLPFLEASFLTAGTLE